MWKNVFWVLLISISLILSSCAENAPPAAFTGWVIGWTNDSAYVPTAKILKTDNGGATWTLQTLPAGCVGFYGNDISAVNGQVAWAAAGDRYYLDGGILHTTDGGASWAWQTLPDGLGSSHIKNIKGVSPDEAWAVSIRGDVLHTTDGGNHWTLVAVQEAGGRIIPIQQVNRMDVTHRDIWIVNGMGGNLGVIHSSDGGITWRQEQLPDIGGSPGPLSVTAFDFQVAWAAVNQSGHLWWTSNGGLSWNKSNDTVGDEADLDDICASGTNVLWVAQNRGSGGGQAARITVTNGSFETNGYTNGNYNMEGISARDDNQTAWLVGQRALFGDPALPYGAIYFTNDGGVTWHLQTLPANALDVNFWKVSFVGARR
jgi:photosystem II stability/assembly factor-like uncharacterized protein